METVNTHKILRYLFYGIAAGAVIFVLVLYQTLKTTAEDVSDLPPFDKVVPETLILKRDAILVKNYQPYVQEHEYLLYDSLDEYIGQGIKAGDFELAATLRRGTEIHTEKAKTFTNGVSGFTEPYILGYVTIGNIRYPFEYRWGNESLEKRLHNAPRRWTFPLAPWQDFPDTRSYALPPAR